MAARHQLGTVLVLGMFAMAPLAAHAADVADPSEIAACRAIAATAERASCYDLLFGRPAESAAEAARAAAPAPTGAPVAPGPDEAAGLARDAVNAQDAPTVHTAMGVRWELDPGTSRGLWLPRGHRRTYILPASWSTERNQQPNSPTQTQIPFPLGLEDLEAKFQLSLKLKAANDLFGSDADLWVGYTQQSYWQVYSSEISRPFRETNYEPEVFTTIPLKFSLLGLDARMVNVGLVHQSNGRANPLSRSWNRVYAQLGLERGPLSLLVRPWLRLNESTDDNNPDIEDYVGRGEVQAIWAHGREHTTSLLARNSFSGSWRGFYQLDYSFPVAGNLRGYVTVSNGYGDSLIDYNHNQTSIGVGVLVIDLL